MNIFGNVDDSLVKDKDNSGSFVLNTGIYKATVKSHYLTNNAKNAVEAHLTLDINGGDHNFTIALTWDGDNSKIGSIVKDFKTKQGGVFKKVKPGYVTLNSLTKITMGKSLKEVSQVKKMVEVQNWETKNKEKKQAYVIEGLDGVKFNVGIIHKQYESQASGKLKDTNAIDKIYNENNQTLSEIENNSSSTYADKFMSEKAGKIFDVYGRNEVTPVVAEQSNTSDDDDVSPFGND